MKLFCIFSDERAYLSRSPELFTEVMKRTGIKGAYVPFKVSPQHVGKALESIKILNIAGANVTVPYKEAVIPHLDILSEGANIIGAINTIVRQGDKLKGYNTNAIGFMDAIDRFDFQVAGKNALVFGTGGAAKAVVFILNWLRAETVWVAGRNTSRLEALVRRLGGEALPLAQLNDSEWNVDLVVNATSVSDPLEAPDLAAQVASLQIPACRLIMDLNYGRKDNFWAEAARKRDIRFVDGLPALAYQARRTFALWTGLQIQPDEFLSVLTPGKE